jgi:hypothetical protein
MTRRSTTTTIVQPLGGAERTGQALKQPNDRDESAGDAAKSDTLAPAQHDHMERARRAVESGHEDTDCRSMPQAPGSACSQPEHSGIEDDVLAPDDRGARNSENRQTAQHDPGKPAAGPTGTARR